MLFDKIIDVFFGKNRYQEIEERYAAKMNDPTKYPFRINYQNGTSEIVSLAYREVDDVWAKDPNHRTIDDIYRVDENGIPC